MSDLICRKTMQRCLHPGMCSPNGGCRSDKSEWQSGYDEGRRMGVKIALDERDQFKAERELLQRAGESLKDEVKRLKGENESLRKALTYIRDTTDDWHVAEKAADALADTKGRP